MRTGKRLRVISSTTDSVFIDTNVLIYTRDRRLTEKRERAREWLAAVSDVGRARMNLQMLNEFTFWILKNEPRRQVSEVRDEVDAIAAWGDRPLDQEDVDVAWVVRGHLGYQWFDCLLVGAAVTAGCRYFLTEDMAHGTTFEGLTLINPFQADPAAIIRRN